MVSLRAKVSPLGQTDTRICLTVSQGANVQRRLQSAVPLRRMAAAARIQEQMSSWQTVAAEGGLRGC